MPTHVLDAALAVDLREPCNDNVMHIPFTFTTSAGGVPTLGYDYDGLLSIVRATNTYTLVLGAPFNALLAAMTTTNSVAHSVQSTPDSGAVALVYAGAFNSQTVHGVLILDVGQR